MHFDFLSNNQLIKSFNFSIRTYCDMLQPNSIAQTVLHIDKKAWTKHPLTNLNWQILKETDKIMLWNWKDKLTLVLGEHK